MKTLIVEDEIHQQQYLLEKLNKHFPEIVVIGVAGEVNKAYDLILREEPELVFMDVHLGSDTCFELLDRLPDHHFNIIFTTSFEEYAVKAFRLAATDYLLKPIDLEELSSAIHKLKNNEQPKHHPDHIDLLLSNLRSMNERDHRIALPTLTGFILIPVNNIMRCESDNTYTTFFLKDGNSHLVSKTLKACERMLIDYAFYRVHNSTLINLRYVKEYIKGEGGIVIMDDNKQINVSRRRKDDFLKLFARIKL